MDRSDETEVILRLPADLRAQLTRLAQSQHRSLQSMLIVILRDAVDRQNTTSRQDVIDQWDERNKPPS